MFIHAVKEGCKHAIRSFWLSATAITVLTVSLGSVLIIASISSAIGASLRLLDEQISIVAFFEQDVEEERKLEIQSELAQESIIQEVEYINTEQAESEIRGQAPGVSDLINRVKEGGVELELGYLYILPDSSESFDEVLEIVESERFESIFGDVASTQGLANRLQQIYRYMQITLVVIITVFGLISILVMANILRITIYNLREEIEVMRLVGATNNYIIAPFLAQSGVFITLANLVLGLLYFPVIILILPNLQNWLDVARSDQDMNLLPQFILIYLSIYLISMLVGLIISTISIKRYLKL